MSSNRLRRIAREIEETSADVHSKIIIQTAAGKDDLTHLEGQFQGPPDTPYEGGKYDIDIRIPNDYPFRPPNMKFMTKIWHPNVSSQTGAICLDTLSTGWSPVFTLKAALISIQSLLASPEPKDPQDAEVATMLLNKPKEFERIANEWAVQYAGAQPKNGSSGAGRSEAENKRNSAENAARKKERDEAEKIAAYHGYSRRNVLQFVDMGFTIESVVAAFEKVGIEKNARMYFELLDEDIANVTAELLRER